MFRRSLAKLFLFLFFFLVSSGLLFAENDLPQLTIISPEENAQILGSKVNVSFIVNNFIFSDFHKREENFTGEGHMLVWLDEEQETVETALQIVKAADFHLTNITEGSHTLVMELVNNDHSSLEPQVRKILSFTTSREKEKADLVNKEEAKQELELFSLTTFAIILIALVVIFFAFIIARNKKLNS